VPARFSLVTKPSLQLTVLSFRVVSNAPLVVGKFREAVEPAT
jgi:hypothetical protein